MTPTKLVKNSKSLQAQSKEMRQEVEECLMFVERELEELEKSEFKNDDQLIYYYRGLVDQHKSLCRQLGQN